MKASRYYINGIGVISPQRTFNNDEFLPDIITYDTNVLSCVLPDFKEYINPIQLRRLSRMLRVGLSSAIICLRDSNNVMPDGIITGTGYGFLTETAKFLTEIYDFDEKQLTPTYFMQSTYNALAGLVALTLKCKGYNNTYVNKGFAFETALHDAIMQLNANHNQTFLVGTFDEMDGAQYKINSRIGYYRKENIKSIQLFENKIEGSLQGEGASFFSISGTPSSQTWCSVKDVKMIFCPEGKEALVQALKDFLSTNTISIQDIDVLVNGVSGDMHNDKLIEEVVHDEFSQIPELRFKHLCGEYCTASSFGLWLAASVLKKQKIPAIAKFNMIDLTFPIKKVLLINQYMGRNYSFIFMEK
jgi:3-oxoacyl-[acyl-carrier-protein] synthase II